MTKETYVRLMMDVTEFDAEDVIATSEVVDPNLRPNLPTGNYEQTSGIPLGF